MYLNSTIAGSIRDGIVATHNGVTTSNRRLDVYSSAIPTNLTSFDPATHAGSLLVRFTGATVENNNSNEAVEYSSGSPPSAATATGTGTATWFALYYSDTSNKAIFGEVTNSGGGGALKLDSVSITSGNSINIGTLSIKLVGVSIA